MKKLKDFLYTMLLGLRSMAISILTFFGIIILFGGGFYLLFLFFYFIYNLLGAITLFVSFIIITLLIMSYFMGLDEKKKHKGLP